MIALLEDAHFSNTEVISFGDGLSIALMEARSKRSSVPQDAKDWRALVEYRCEDDESFDFEAELLLCVRPDIDGRMRLWHPARHLRVEAISDAERAQEWADR